MPRIHYEDLQTVTDGPRAVIRTCSECRAKTHMRFKGYVGGRAGRGVGMREGNKGNSATLAHWKEVHPEALRALMAQWGFAA
jgi:hypothetical protein